MSLARKVFFVHIDCFFICKERDIFRSLSNRAKRMSRRIYQSETRKVLSSRSSRVCADVAREFLETKDFFFIQIVYRWRWISITKKRVISREKISHDVRIIVGISRKNLGIFVLCT